MELLVDVLKKYNLLKKSINDSDNLVVYSTQNGRRLIREDKRGFFCLTENLRLVSMNDTDKETYLFSKTPFDIIEGYFTDTKSVALTEIIIFQRDELSLAFKWLQNDLDEKEIPRWKPE